MKKLLTLLFSVLMAVSAIATPWDGTVATAFAGGTGTSADPYQIATAEQLAYLASLANATQTANSNTAGKYYQLTADIDLNGPTKSWTPIGSLTTAAFAGIFDGGNHIISNIYINSTAVNQGLFGYVVGTSSVNLSAIVKNITIGSGSVTTNQNYAAGVAARCQFAQISNCKNTIPVTGLAYSGGVVGRADGVSIIEYCGNTGIIKSTAASNSHTGGVVAAFGGLTTNGASDVSYLRMCYNRGFVNAPSYAGGITGNATGNLTIDRCFNTAPITSNTPGTGGIVGYGYTNVSGVLNISNCYNTGAITTNTTGNFAGGILGYVATGKTYGTISNCYNTGIISSTTKEAIVGQAGGTVTNCYYLSTLTLTAANGGTSTLAVDMQAATFVSVTANPNTSVNANQNPAVWSTDITPNFNGGYPILSWVTSLTKLTAPTLQSPTNITSTSFTANWSTVPNAIGYCVNVYTNASPSVYKTSLYVAGQSSTSASFSGLTANTSYIYKVISVAPSGTTYIDSEESTSVIAGLGGATVLLSSYSQASATSATINCTVNDGGGTGVTARGICYATSTANPTTTNSTVIDPGTGNGSYSATMSSLIPNTTYYFRAYATNNNRTNYSNVYSFKILSAPDVSTSVASNITASGFTANWAAVTNANSYDVMVFDNTSTQVGSTVNVAAGTLSLDVSGLSANSNYTYTVTAKGDNVNYFNSAASTAVAVSTTIGTGLIKTAIGVSIWAENNQIICSETGNINIYNLQGAQLMQANNIRIMNTSLPKGIYLVLYKNMLGEQTVKKISIY